MGAIGDFDRDEDRDNFEGGQTDARPEQTLAFDRNGESLPWLESDEDYEEDDGVDTRRLITFALAGIGLLAVLIGLVWWLTHRGPGSDMVPNGSTIAAPEQPYKIKPSNPGGKTYAGTGDQSFVVGEGQSPEGRIATAPAPAPAPVTAPKASASAGSAAGEDEQAATGGVGVQVGAYISRETAEAGWQRLTTNHEVLKGYKHRVVEGTADIGTVYRLQAVTGDAASANQLCSALRSEGAACQVKR